MLLLAVGVQQLELPCCVLSCSLSIWTAMNRPPQQRRLHPSDIHVALHILAVRKAVRLEKALPWRPLAVLCWKPRLGVTIGHGVLQQPLYESAGPS